MSHIKFKSKNLVVNQIDKLKKFALTLDGADELPPSKSSKVSLVFASIRYINIDKLSARRIKFCQLLLEIYRIITSQLPKSKVE